mgnify:CR=1 FL=1
MKNKLYLYLQENFKENEPFFYKDINFSSSIDSIRHQISRFVKEGKLCKYNNGTFFIPKNSLLGLPSVISSEKVAASKYIKHNDEIIGYYSGYTCFHNRFPDRIYKTSQRYSTSSHGFPSG